MVQGLCLGYCPTGSLFLNERAHAHVRGRFKGFICVAPGHEPTDQLLLHELAHLYEPGGHEKRWRRRFLALAEQHSPEMASMVALELEEWYTSQPGRRTTPRAATLTAT